MGRYSPSSSPASSPTFGPVDSSPPCSPTNGHFSLHDDEHTAAGTPRAGPSGGLIHPFAGSAKATRAPPAYELRTPRSPQIPIAGPSTLDTPLGATASPTRYPSMPLSADSSFVARMTESGHAREVDAGRGPSLARRALFSSQAHTSMTDEERWEQVVSDAIERKGHPADDRTEIDVSGSTFSRPLTTIAPVIADLQNLFVCTPNPGTMATVTPNSPPLGVAVANRHLSRVQTVPAAAFQSLPVLPARIARTATMAIVPSSSVHRSPRHEVQLNVSNNEISRLPSELFLVENLTVLNLRGNQLSYLPPAIIKLRHLRDLNLAMNQLRFLPSEILEMSHLSSLILVGNPFQPAPSQLDQRSNTSAPRALAALPGLLPNVPVPSPVSEPSFTSHDPIPACTELAIRVLLAPYQPRIAALPSSASTITSIVAAPQRSARVITALHGQLQPAETRIPAHLLDIIRACAPDAVATSALSSSIPPSAPAIAGNWAPVEYGVCPNPAHVGMRPFYQHAEERYSWEDHVGGIELNTGPVPFLWRGCSRGCLDFLVASPADSSADGVNAEAAVQDHVRRSPRVGLGVGLAFE